MCEFCTKKKVQQNARSHQDDGAREWNARDGRVTDLGLHCTVAPAAGNKITIAIRASAGSENTTG
ncbi:hypothetical protein UK99_23200 [Frankia casuarinae]|nr:hypothetical protein UK99_23215 [Frankia casuarinae]ORT90127.1 hypothetical protein UK99_23200 [Frankia casuarinae]